MAKRATNKRPRKKPKKTTKKAKKIVCKGGVCRRVKTKAPQRRAPSQLRRTASSEIARGRRKKLKFNRPSPAESAVAHRVGTVRTGNDGNFYIIKRRSNGVHFWARY